MLGHMVIPHLTSCEIDKQFSKGYNPFTFIMEVHTVPMSALSGKPLSFAVMINTGNIAILDMW